MDALLGDDERGFLGVCRRIFNICSCQARIRASGSQQLSATETCTSFDVSDIRLLMSLEADRLSRTPQQIASGISLRLSVQHA